MRPLGEATPTQSKYKPGPEATMTRNLEDLVGFTGLSRPAINRREELGVVGSDDDEKSRRFVDFTGLSGPPP